jgi:hypothetical protein
MSDKKKRKIWHSQTEKILKDWAELSSCYRYMHTNAFNVYKNKNLWFTIPLIIVSTITGTANFSQSSVKGTSIETLFPIIIGSLNLIAGMVSTIHQTLKYSSLEEGHRISAMSFGKLSRNIKIELNLPVQERSCSGSEFLCTVRAELDRLLEQSPIITMNIIQNFESKFKELNIYKPEIIDIKGVDIYKNNNGILEMMTNTVNTIKDYEEYKRRSPSSMFLNGDPNTDDLNDSISGLQMQVNSLDNKGGDDNEDDNDDDNNDDSIEITIDKK